jgi:hypothetical protein
MEGNMMKTIRLTDIERERLLWWLYQPVPPGPAKELDVQIIRKLEDADREPNVKVVSYFGDSTNMIEHLVQDLIDRGGLVVSLAIGYGPPPSKVAGQSYAPDNSWHGLVVADMSGVDPDA